MKELFESALPGSLEFLLAGLAVGLALLYWPRGSRWGRRWLAALIGMYWLASLPLVCGMMAGLLGAGFHPLAVPEAARGATAIVVLDAHTFRYAAAGGVVETVGRSAALRTLEAVRVYWMLDHPIVIVSAGVKRLDSRRRPEGQAIRDELIRAGVPADRILLDSASSDTRQHAVNLTRMLRERGVASFVLVTSPTHMRRAWLSFRREGVNPIPSVSALWHVPFGPHDWRRVWPSAEALEISEETVHDVIGLVYYGARGWLDIF